MGPKKKGKEGKEKKKKGKEPQVVDGMSISDMSREMLEGHVIRIRKELDREREERNYFQLEKDNLWSYWEITKKQLEDLKIELKNKERDLEEMEEKREIEMKLYKQKVKHLLYEHKISLADSKIECENILSNQESSHKALENEQISDLRELRLLIKEQELAHEDHVKELKTEKVDAIHSIQENFEMQTKELETKWDHRLKTVREDLDLQRRTEIHQLEERKNIQIQALIQNHEKAFIDIKNYYNDITLNNLALINSLKEQTEMLRKKEDRAERDMQHLQQENQRLKEPLQSAKQEVADLRRIVVNYEKDKLALKNTRVQLKSKTDENAQLKWELEILKQRFHQLEEERDSVYEKFLAAINEVHQKTNLKNVIIERQLEKVAERLEIKDAQLHEVLLKSNLDPDTASQIKHRIEDQMEKKSVALHELQLELAEVCKAHNDLLRIFESKMEECKLSICDLGLRPIYPSSYNFQELGAGPIKISGV